MVIWVRKVVWLIFLLSPMFTGAQEKLETPSQKTKEAVDKLLQAPSVVSKSLQDSSNTAKAKLQDAMAEPKSTKSNSDGAAPVEQKSDPQSPVNFSTGEKRDPFRPFTLNPRTNSRPRENLSPLERVEFGQINLVGIVWDEKEPKALVEVAEPDDKARGYIVRIGTPIGTADGKVRGITRNEIFIEEFYTDIYGARRTREVSKKLATE